MLTQIDQVKLSVNMQAESAIDAAEMPLKVEPEGYRINHNMPHIDMTDTATSLGKTDQTAHSATTQTAQPKRKGRRGIASMSCMFSGSVD